MATTVRLEAATEQRLDQLAQLTGRTKAFYLRQLIEAGLDDVSSDALQSLITISAEPDHVALVPVAADDTDRQPL